MDKRAQFYPTKRMTANGWVRTYARPVRRSWLVRLIEWLRG